MHRLKINLFGEGWRLMKVRVNATNAQDCINDINNGNTELYSYDLLAHGLVATYKSQIEIWYAGKKVLKLRVKDLNNDFLLFPLYKSVSSVFDCEKLCKGVYLEEREIGLVATFEAKLPYFKIDKLSFYLLNVLNGDRKFKLLHAIDYKGMSLALLEKKRDTLVIAQNCFERS